MNETNGVEADESPTLGKLAAALAKAQGAMNNAEKTANNPGFNRKYATLAAVWDACREPLAANGLAVVQRVGGGDGRVILTTDLIHAESGEFMRSRWVVPADVEARRNAVQALGSATTYARRYALAALVGVAVEDDDGEGAGAKGGRRQDREEQRDPTPESGSRLAPNGSAPTTFPNYGKAKGEAINGAPLPTLEFYANGCRRSLADASKVKFHDKEQALLNAIVAEIARQTGPSPAPPPGEKPLFDPAPSKKSLVVEVRDGETEEAAKARSIYETACELIQRAQSLAQVDKVVASAKGKVTAAGSAALEDKAWARKNELQHPAAFPEPGENG